MLIIGERINSSRQPISQAIERHDEEFIRKEDSGLINYQANS